MLSAKCAEIAEVVSGTLISGDPGLIINGVCTDTRKLEKGSLFIPIKGENFDGHDFISKAFEMGVAASLTEKREMALSSQEKGLPLIKVQDTVRAYGALAANYRMKFSAPFIAVTGSAGKTSTKDMIACALGSRLEVLKTEANFNNEIGLPSTILKLHDKYEAVVVEMGMRSPGDIAYLSRIARPDIVVITNIGTAHIERLGSREKIFRAKMEILEGLRYNGLLVLNADDDLLYKVEGGRKYRTVYYGISKNAELRASGIRSEGEAGTRFNIMTGNNRYEVFVPAPGVHNVYNALAAIAAGMETGLGAEELIEGIRSFIPGKMRLNIIDKGGIKIINDAYNANPQSVRAALNVLVEMAAGKRAVAVLGDMLELGRFSRLYHNSMGRYAAETGVGMLAAAGKYAADIAEGALKAGMVNENIAVFNNVNELVPYLDSSLKEGDVVLFKASRGMKMEDVIEKIVSDTGSRKAGLN